MGSSIRQHPGLAPKGVFEKILKWAVIPTLQNRQDLSTGYLVKVGSGQEIQINKDHFISFKIVNSIPEPIGAMYKYYLQQYLGLKK